MIHEQDNPRDSPEGLHGGGQDDLDDLLLSAGSSERLSNVLEVRRKPVDRPVIGFSK
ncbi:hypothetical protein [Deinococcus alpinitundrae]|uniref:hypothetical protein n=1 Tax=Deinococcus alpinitundrae TaxID=468913 RepID=UPI001379DAC1|nr:hypothetical protein [Deinococcus alpinitundrae]